jgi:hypothetical protein
MYSVLPTITPGEYGRSVGAPAGRTTRRVEGAGWASASVAHMTATTRVSAPRTQRPDLVRGEDGRQDVVK